MRAHEFVKQQKERLRGLTLRQINQMKHEERRREQERADRRRVIAVMYRDANEDARQMDLAKQRLELEQQRLEVEQQRLEVEAARRVPELENLEAISRMARSEMSNQDRSAARIEQLARSAMRRKRR
jgi:hypothetical protein